MADFDNLNLDTVYTTYFPNLKEAIRNLSTWLDGTTDSNLPDKAKRWNSANRRPEIYDILADTWGPMLEVTDETQPYEIRVAEANHADDATYADTAGNATHATSADLATNATNLGGTPAASYVKNTDVGNVVGHNVGIGTDQVPLAQHLSSGAYTTVGTAAQRDYGIGYDDLTTVSYVKQRLTFVSYHRSVTMIAPNEHPTIYAPYEGYKFLCAETGLIDAISADGSWVELRNSGTMTYAHACIWFKLG